MDKLPQVVNHFLNSNCTWDNKYVALVPTGDILVNKLETMLTGFGYIVRKFSSESEY